MLSDLIAHVAAYGQRIHSFMLVSVIVAADVQNHVYFVTAMYLLACGMTMLRLVLLGIARYGYFSPFP